MTQGLHRETLLRGLPLSAGVAVGRVCRFNENRHNNLPVYEVHGEGIEREVRRVGRAVEVAIERLEAVRVEAEKKIGKAEAEIFAAQQTILRDPGLRTKTESLIRSEHANAEAAVMAVMDSYEARLRDLDNEYLRERASDIGELKRRLLDVLANLNPGFQCASSGHCQRGHHRIVVARELTPGMTMELDTAHTLGFVTERGGPTSHAAILARALGIPAVTGVPDLHRTIECGSEIVVNGHTGEVVVWPSEKTVAATRTRHGDIRAPSAVDPVPGLEVMANISVAAEAAEAVAMRAEGIGLYRTEFEFMAAGRMLDEDEQYARYASVLDRLRGLPVTFRLFDAGGDKPLPFLSLAPEANPALGWRGARLLLGHGDLLRTQARALARASRHGPVRVLYPMIVDLGQFVQLKRLFESAVQDLPPGEVRHGVMFEVPSACLEAEALLEVADFGSIGTNDLIQYLFAVDRNNDRVAHDYSPDRPILWSVIRNLSRAGERTGKAVSVCGELAGDPRYVLRLMDAGIRAVSVSSRMIPGARNAAASFTRNLGVVGGTEEDA